MLHPVALKIGGIFLWHFPRSYLHWELSSKFGLSGVRTFLRLVFFGQIRNYLAYSLIYLVYYLFLTDSLKNI